jgi:hypothetical protein
LDSWVAGRNSEAATAHVSVIKCFVLKCWCLKIAANAALALAKGNVIEGRSYNRATMAKKEKKQIRRVWTKEDLRLMKSMAKDRKGVTKIAKALKRTPGATTVMAAKRGVSLSMRG